MDMKSNSATNDEWKIMSFRCPPRLRSEIDASVADMKGVNVTQASWIVFLLISAYKDKLYDMLPKQGFTVPGSKDNEL